MKAGKYEVSTIPSGERFIAEVFEGEEYKRAFKGKLIIDIGANLGTFCLYAYEYADKIFAVEPAKTNFKCLQKTVKDNSLSRIETFNLAIGGKNGSRLLVGSDDSSGGWSLGGEANEQLGVTTKTLATFMRETGIEYVDIVKIDVEGAEDEIFSADDFPEVANKIGLIIGESHSNSHLEPILSGHGFSYESVGNNVFLARRI